MSGEDKYLLDNRYLFDPNTRSVVDKTRDDETIWLGSNESNILLAFSNRSNELISREQLHELVWIDKGFHVDDSSVIQAISTLRKLLKDSAKSPSFIKTIPKQGYQFIASVKQLNKGDVYQNREIELSEKSSSESHLNTNQATGGLEPGRTTDKTENKHGTKSILAYFALFLVSLALVLEPMRPSFRTVDTVEGIDIKTFNGQMLEGEWNKGLKYCVQQYLKGTATAQWPKAVILTLDSRGNFSMNAIGTKQVSSFTALFVATKNELTEECALRWNHD